MCSVGSPGRGKSQCAKNLIRSWLALGAGMHLFDPTDAREHERALNDFDNKIVIDIQRMNFSLDGLRVFPYQEAAEKTIDHLLPQLGFSPLTRQAKRLAGLLSPESRETRGIGSTMALIRYLRDLPAAERTSADEDLLIGLEGLSSERLLRPLFDETLPTPDLASTQCVIWNFAGLDLPTVTEEYVAHLHEQTTPGQRAAQALWGLGADLAVSIFFARPEQPDMLVVEECAPWAHSPGGQKTANKVITQGRKAWTGFAGISQQPIKDIKETLKHEFIDQRVCFGFKDAELARATLQWCGRDLNRHPDLLTNYVSNTSPVQLVDHGDDSIDTRHGKVIAGREGEAWFLDEFGGFGKFRAFEAPTAELAQRYDTNPHRNRRRNQARSRMTARLYYWYLPHPRWGRPALLVVVLQALSITAVCAAPQASAATNASILNFTGLTDTYGVPIGDYYLSLARCATRSLRPARTWAGIRELDELVRPHLVDHDEQLLDRQLADRRSRAVHRHHRAGAVAS